MTLTETFETCLGIKGSEAVLLLSDEEMSGVARIVEEALSPLADELLVIMMKPGKIHGAELPKSVAAAMASSDVVVGVTSKSMTHTEATKRAVRHGTRVASMPGIAVEMLTKGGMTADYVEVAETARRIADLLTGGRIIEIKTPLGTDFKADIHGRQGYADTGLLTNKGDFGNLPGGEGFIAPLEGKSEGRIVFDGPIASSGLDHDPFIVEIKEGRVARTNYRELEKILSEIENASFVGEIGIGVNPRARLIGNILEDEKVLGTAHIAFGNNSNFGGKVEAKVHLDGIIKEPTIRVDGKTIVKEGSLAT